MELKEFIRKVIGDTIEAVDEASASSSRGVKLANMNDRRTIEFDVAVVVEEETRAQGKAGVKVLSVIDAGGDVSKNKKNLTNHRIAFGVNVDHWTKAEQVAHQTETQRLNEQYGETI